MNQKLIASNSRSPSLQGEEKELSQLSTRAQLLPLPLPVPCSCLQNVINCSPIENILPPTSQQHREWLSGIIALQFGLLEGSRMQPHPLLPSCWRILSIFGQNSKCWGIDSAPVEDKRQITRAEMVERFQKHI